MADREKRSASRRHLKYPCWIVAAPEKPGILAHIADISKTGALLRTEAPGDLPNQFVLNLTENGKAYRRCRVARRPDGNSVAVIFLPNGRH